MKLAFNISTMVAGVGLLAYFLFDPRLHPLSAMQIIGAIVGFPSIGLVILARFQLGKSFSLRPKAVALVTHGLYSRIRNPIYIFGGLAVAGLCLALNKPRFLWILAVLAPLQILRIRREEKVLTKKFGEEYLRYRKQTWF